MNKVTILGLGYIGLPTAAMLASKDVHVHGVDINEGVVETINKGEVHFHEPDLERMVSDAVEKKLLVASLEPQQSEIYLIVVPTPFNDKKEPDISFVLDAASNISEFLKEDDLIIIESTSPVGTTEKVKNLVEVKRPDLRNKLNFAYCPERVLPGNIMYELINNDRVVGGLTKQATEMASEFYELFVEGEIHKTDAKTAEMCKLVENSSRDVQIAFANELSLICEKAGINVWELIDLANKHPRVNILKPGAGVGGHCIAVDPYFILSDYPLESQLIAKAREINNYKSFWVAEKITEARKSFEIEHGRKPKLALMGLAFKPNVDDLRESPAKYIVQKVIQDMQDEDVYIVEPNIESHNIFKLTDYAEATASADIIAYLVAHDEFKSIKLNSNQIELNFCGV